MKQFDYLVTGCSGLVGGRLTAGLCNSGKSVFGIRGSRPCLISHGIHECVQIDLLKEDLSEVFKVIKAQTLIHSAWEMTPDSYLTNPINFKWHEISVDLISRFIDSGGGKVVVTGTCAEYAWDQKIPLIESSVEMPTTAYGESKLKLLRSIQQQNIPYLWTRTFFQFGFDRNRNKLIPSVIDCAYSGGDLVLSNPGDVRDFIYAEDLVNCLILLLNKDSQGVVNLGSGNGYRVDEVVTLIAEITGRIIRVSYKELSESSSFVVADIGTLRNLVGNDVQFSLKIALEKVIREKSLTRGFPKLIGESNG